ncbi:MAG: DUF4272 domain-containing protein [Gammaproteobacteria bacterium]|nr:DUF4272 domain-containing protein [Gammaproteobacteria bacterium]MDH5799536.1 DUF4272 domain-containing protein [Gammaproteobacteria bacterium]
MNNLNLPPLKIVRISYSILLFLFFLSNTASAGSLDINEAMQKRQKLAAEQNIKIRSADEVAKRALALMVMVSRVHEENPQDLMAWVERNKVNEYFTEKEKAVFHQKELMHQEKIEFSWKSEALVSLFWALNMIDPYPSLKDQVYIFNYKKVLAIVDDPAKFIAEAKLRSKKEIEAKETELYQQHWRIRDAHITNKTMPAELDPDIVFQRNYGLSWLVGWGESWEKVPTDTLGELPKG